MRDVPEPRGESLRDRLHAVVQEGRRGLPITELIPHIMEVFKLLDGRIHPHGNVKPDSIMLKSDRIYLCERPVGERVSFTDPGGTSGTPAYMAPEVWGGTRTARSDQYALACTYAEVRAGRTLFVGLGVMDIRQAQLKSAPDLAECSDAERGVLVQALAKDPDQWFPTCLRLVERLRDALGSMQA